jgi:C-terminal processing protease CtpA/Prc
MIKLSRLLPLIALLLLNLDLTAEEQAPVPANLSDEEKLYGLSLFWKEVSYNFAYFHQVPDLDFDAAYRAFIPAVLATDSTYEYYRELQRFNALLKDGHTNIYMPSGLSAAHEDWPAIRLIEAGGKALIYRVGNSLADTIPLGSIVTAVDGRPVDQYLEEQVMPYVASSTDHIRLAVGVSRLLRGEPGSEFTITFEKPDGESTAVTLVRDDRHKKEDYIQFKLPKSNGELLEFRWINDSIAYLALNAFHDEAIVPQFEAIYEELKTCSGLIIDLRFNGGGSSDIAMEILSHFTDEPLNGAVWKTRKHVAAYKAWGNFDEKYKAYAEGDAWKEGSMPLLEPKTGNTHIVPTCVLIGRRTASAAEDFLVFADKVPHFTTIGEKTYGSSGQPIIVDLPGGGNFRVCTKVDTYPDGREFIGYGIIPDVEIGRKPEHIRGETDFVLDQAVTRLQGSLKNQP